MTKFVDTEVTNEEALGLWYEIDDPDAGCCVDGCGETATYVSGRDDDPHMICFGHLMKLVMDASPDKFAEDPEKPDHYRWVDPTIN